MAKGIKSPNSFIRELDSLVMTVSMNRLSLDAHSRARHLVVMGFSWDGSLGCESSLVKETCTWGGSECLVLSG